MRARIDGQCQVVICVYCAGNGVWVSVDLRILGGCVCITQTALLVMFAFWAGQVGRGKVVHFISWLSERCVCFVRSVFGSNKL